jgi:pSer/pThr/pTyr-binding forkhead associated (FHA) protein
MFYKLVLQNHVEGLTEKSWNFTPPAVVGRDAGADVCFEHDSISRKHCQFSLNGEGTLVVKDLESMNGIYVDDHRVQHATLMPHQTLQIGGIIVKVEFIEESEFKQPVIKPKGSVYTTQPMPTLPRTALPTSATPDKPWWRRLFE